ncbi:Atp25p ASCRUDRAFT_71871 [Ascoidea rubescens DSM 1968]|uniref:ATPase synthesis protein 25 n=1 Tax=Ascoidea rubescens DSM 1968 TaxID=1344418 RepID=A0A1D2VBR7_9ASCO|nr:hypothetical protein ASCRUDRAFT_71871 [Ascoidea rubescens DSM 1968]ODV59144.1 hypothetical protein ASCRUDRAFT_71871 [Ascoidea rubescens DSM 1968]
MIRSRLGSRAIIPLYGIRNAWLSRAVHINSFIYQKQSTGLDNGENTLNNIPIESDGEVVQLAKPIDNLNLGFQKNSILLFYNLAAASTVSSKGFDPITSEEYGLEEEETDDVSTPWYLRDDSSELQVPISDIQMPEIPEDAPKTLEPILLDLTKRLGIYDVTIMDLKLLDSTDQTATKGFADYMIIGSCKSEKHAYKAAKLHAEFIKNTYSEIPYVEGLDKSATSSAKLKKLKKKAKKRVSSVDKYYGVSDSSTANSWIMIDTKCDNIFINFLTEQRRYDLNLELLWSPKEEHYKYVRHDQNKFDDNDNIFSGIRRFHSLSTPHLDLELKLNNFTNHTNFQPNSGLGTRKYSTMAQNVEGVEGFEKFEQTGVKFLIEKLKGFPFSGNFLTSLLAFDRNPDLAFDNEALDNILTTFVLFANFCYVKKYNDIIDKYFVAAFDEVFPLYASNNQWIIYYKFLETIHFNDPSLVSLEHLKENLYMKQSGGHMVTQEDIKMFVNTVEKSPEVSLNTKSPSKLEKILNKRISFIMSFFKDCFVLRTQTLEINEDLYFSILKVAAPLNSSHFIKPEQVLLEVSREFSPAVHVLKPKNSLGNDLFLFPVEQLIMLTGYFFTNKNISLEVKNKAYSILLSYMVCADDWMDLWALWSSRGAVPKDMLERNLAFRTTRGFKYDKKPWSYFLNLLYLKDNLAVNRNLLTKVMPYYFRNDFLSHFKSEEQEKIINGLKKLLNVADPEKQCSEIRDAIDFW